MVSYLDEYLFQGTHLIQDFSEFKIFCGSSISQKEYMNEQGISRRFPTIFSSSILREISVDLDDNLGLERL